MCVCVLKNVPPFVCRFQTKYHPDVCESHKASQLKAYAVRLDAFKKLQAMINDPDLTVDLNKDQMLTRLLDSGW